MITGQSTTQATLTPNERFRNAIEADDRDAIRELLPLITPGELTLEERLDALSYSAELGNLEVLNVLLAFDNVLENVTAHDNQILRLAVLNGQLAVVNRLLEIPAILGNVTAINDAFGRAVRNGHLALVNRLLEIPAVVENVSAGNNRALIFAVEDGYLGIVNRLLEIPAVEGQATVNNNVILGSAVSYGRLEMVNRLLQIPAVMEQATINGNEILRLAAFKGHLAVVNRLLEIPAVLGNVTADINGAFGRAIGGGHLALVNRFLEIPAVFEGVTGHNIGYMLELAASSGHLALVNRLLEIHAVLENVTGINIRYTLGTAARSGQLAMVNRFLEIPAVVENVTAGDNYALRLAAENGYLEIVNRLLEIPAVVEQATVNGNEILGSAVLNGQFAVVNRLLEIPAILENVTGNNIEYTLGTAASNGQLAMVNRFLEIPAVVENVTAGGNYALRSAAGNGRLEIVNRLLEIPAVVEQAIVNDNEILRLAIQNNHIAVVNRLLEIPTVVENVTAGDNYALTLTAENGYLEIANRLLEIPAVVEQATVNDNVILGSAVSYGRLEMVNRLLQIPAVMEQATINGNEILRSAAFKGHLEVVNRLLEIPAVIENVAGNNILAFAASSGQFAVVNRLLEIPAVVENVTAGNNHALRSAAENGCLEIVNRLLEIPAVEEQAAVNDNEILKLAAENNHGAVVDRLMQILAVRNDAPAHLQFFTPNHHHHGSVFDSFQDILGNLQSPTFSLFSDSEAFPDDSLATIAADGESSMHSTSTENLAIKQLKMRFAKPFAERGQKAILEDLRSYLVTQASLPLTYDAKLSAEQQQIYYQNPFHSAWRYLYCSSAENPNPWMNPIADGDWIKWVNGDPTTGTGYADIREDHQELIAYLWLAIQEATPADIPDGFTKDSLRAHFASELGLIGRAHNWDNTRKKISKKNNRDVEINEVYDDSRGDKPTCFMGVTRRLAQLLETILKPTSPEERPLNVDIIKGMFRDQFISSNSSKRGFVEDINQGELSDLIEIREALKALVENMGDFNELDERQKAILASFMIGEKEMDELVARCGKYFGERILTTPCKASDGTPYSSYAEYLSTHLAKKWFYIEFYNDVSQQVQAKIEELRASEIIHTEDKVEKEGKEIRENRKIDEVSSSLLFSSQAQSRVRKKAEENRNPKEKSQSPQSHGKNAYTDRSGRWVWVRKTQATKKTAPKKKFFWRKKS